MFLSKTLSDEEPKSVAGPGGEEGAEAPGLAPKHGHTDTHRNPQDFVTLGCVVGVVSGVLTQVSLFPKWATCPALTPGKGGISRYPKEDYRSEEAAEAPRIPGAVWKHRECSGGA